MSVAWFTRLHELNEAGRFEEVVKLSAKFIAARPRDYALRLQTGKALLSLGELKAARAQLDAAVKHSKGLAAWPWFYVAAVHARTGETAQMFTALERAQAIDKKLARAAYDSPWFAAFWHSTRFQDLFPSPRREEGQGEGPTTHIRPTKRPAARRSDPSPQPSPRLGAREPRSATRTTRPGSKPPPGRAATSRPSTPKRRAPAARGRTRGGASSRRRGGG